MIKLICLFLLLFVFGNCTKFSLFKDDELHLKKKPYTGNELNINGYYFLEYGDPIEYRRVYFFYRDGTILYGSSYSIDKIAEKERDYTTDEWQSKVKEIKHRWGVFQIEGNKILFERWYPSQPPLKTDIREGEILNDTTFIITKAYRMKNGKKTEKEEDLNEIHQFKAFSPKPDSTNKFVK